MCSQVELDKNGDADKEEDKNGDYGQEACGTTVDTVEQLVRKHEFYKYKTHFLMFCFHLQTVPSPCKQ